MFLLEEELNERARNILIEKGVIEITPEIEEEKTGHLRCADYT